MSFAYSVAIKLSVANLASQGIRILATDLLAAHGAAAKLEDKLKALKLVAVGYGLEKIGSGMLGFLEKSVDASKEYTRQLSLMHTVGMSQKEIAEATAAAWKTSKEVITSSASENLGVILELRSVFHGHMKEAYAALPILQRTAALIEGKTGRHDPHLGFAMVKFAEETNKGALSKEALEKSLNMQARGLLAFGGTIDANDYLMAAKYAKTSALKMSDEFKYMILPSLIQELKSKGGGASMVGTITERLRGMVVGGQIAQHDIQNWIDAGLIDTRKVVKNKHGIGSKLLPGAVIGSDMLDFDPYLWVQKYGLPGVRRLMQTKGLTEDQAISALSRQINKNFGISTLIRKAAQLERNKDLIESTPTSYVAYQKALQTNPVLAEMALHAQWQNVQARIGYEILPKLIPYMIQFADALDGIGQWMQKHPVRTEWLVKGIAGIGIGMVALGNILMTGAVIKFFGLGPAVLKSIILKAITWSGTKFMSFMKFVGKGISLFVKGLLYLGRALFMNPIGLTITAIAAAAFLLWKNWDYVGPKLKAAWDGIKSAVGALADWLRAKWEWIKSYLPSSWFSDSKGSGGAVAQPAVAAQPTGGSPYVATKADQPVQVTTQINMDGRKVAEAVSQHQAKAVSRPFAGSASFDYGMAAPPVGMGYAR